MLVNSTSKIYVGSTEVEKVYQGNTLIYEKQSTPYTPLSYIESTGTQWINTFVSPTINTEIEIDFAYTSNTTNGNTRVFGMRRTWDNGFYLGTAGNRMGDKYWYVFGNKYEYNGANLNTDTDRHILKLNTNELVVDGVKISTVNNTASLPTYAPICLFGAFDGNATTPITGICRIYECKLYESGTLVKDFIPVLDEHNVPCMYDKVAKQFYYNLGTGTFSYSMLT